MKRGLIGVFVGILSLCAVAGAAEAGGKRTLASHVYGCYRGIIQDGRGGIAAVEPAYEAMSELVDRRHNVFALWRLLEECQDLYSSLPEEALVDRLDYYDEVFALIGGTQPSAGTELERKLFVLMVGLRDEVSRCITLTGALVYAAGFGIAGNLSGGLCNNFDGEYYVRSSGGLGISLGAGVNTSIFPENRLSVTGRRTGSLSALTKTVAAAILEEVFEQETGAWPPSLELFEADLYVIGSVGVGLLLPLSSLLDTPSSQAGASACLETLEIVFQSPGSQTTVLEALETFSDCLQTGPGIALGVGVNIAAIIELPVHLTIPLLRLPATLSSVIYGQVSQADAASVELGAVFLSAGSVPVPPTP